MTLPPLPIPAMTELKPYTEYGVSDTPLEHWYDLDQMLSYGAACAAAERQWRDTVDDMLTVCHAVASDDPRESINRLIDWHVQVALDPAVSSDAAALIERGRTAAEPAIVTGDHPSDSHQLVSCEAAMEAVDHLDDYARMSVGVDAAGPRETLIKFIEQQRKPLTIGQIKRIAAQCEFGVCDQSQTTSFARAIERAVTGEQK